MSNNTDYAVQNYLITPAALAANQRPPQNISDQKWLITLSGVMIVNVKCVSRNDWTGATITLDPDYYTAIQEAINHFSIPVPTDSPYVVDSYDQPRIVPNFKVDQYTFHAALGSVYDSGTAVNAGFSVNSWKPVPFVTLTDSRPNGNAPTLTRIYAGFLVDVAVHDIEAMLYRINYQITLLGNIVFVRRQGR